jgi:hypothetical protein
MSSTEVEDVISGLPIDNVEIGGGKRSYQDGIILYPFLSSVYRTSTRISTKLAATS